MGGVHHLIVAIYWSGAWHDLAEADVVDGSASSLRGLTEDGSGRPGEAKLRIVDNAQRFDPDNELSDLYGLIGPRTPIRITTDGVVDFVGEAASWSPGRTADYQPGPPQRGWQWTDVTASGVLRRVGAFPKILDSAARRYFPTSRGIRSYWPFEETSAATQAASGLPFGPPALYPVDAIAPGSVDGPGGSLQAAAVASVPPAWGAPYAPIPSGRWYWVLGGRIPPEVNPAAPAGQLMWRLFTSTGYVVELASVSAAQWRMSTYNASGNSDVATVSWNANGRWASVPGYWVQWQMAVTPGASTSIDYGVMDYEGGTGVPGSGGGVEINTRVQAWDLGYPVRWEGPTWVGFEFCHHALYDSTMFDSGPWMQSFHGWVGEGGMARISRLAQENGIACVLQQEPPEETVRYGSEGMGPQRPDTLPNLFKEAAATNALILTEDRASAALLVRSLRSTYALPVLQLVYPRDVVAPFIKTTDDVDFANTVVVKNRDGADATAQLVSGPIGTAAIGPEKRDVAVNVQLESELPRMAQYWLNLWSSPGARYPSIVIDAELLPSLAAAAAQLVPGDLITVTGFRPQTIWLQVVAVAPSTSTARRQITITTLPATPIGRVGTYDLATDRYDVVSAVAVAAGTTGAITVDAADMFNVWSTTAVPYDWSVRGERVTVTAITAPVLMSGRYRQTATCTRSVNGAVRSHPVGTAVGLYDPCYWGR